MNFDLFLSDDILFIRYLNNYLMSVFRDGYLVRSIMWSVTMNDIKNTLCHCRILTMASQ